MAVYIMDFMKAFDTVPHRRLLYKLQYNGIDSIIWGWIRDFLTDRNQRVRNNGHSSPWLPVTSGIPPGLCIETNMLFVIYINDLPCNISSAMHLFCRDL